MLGLIMIMLDDARSEAIPSHLLDNELHYDVNHNFVSHSLELGVVCPGHQPRKYHDHVKLGLRREHGYRHVHMSEAPADHAHKLLGTV